MILIKIKTKLWDTLKKQWIRAQYMYCSRSGDILGGDGPEDYVVFLNNLVHPSSHYIEEINPQNNEATKNLRANGCVGHLKRDFEVYSRGRFKEVRCIGLKDVSGTGIYEGDYVVLSKCPGLLFKVVWCNGETYEIPSEKEKCSVLMAQFCMELVYKHPNIEKRTRDPDIGVHEEFAMLESTKEILIVGNEFETSVSEFPNIS